MTREETVRKIAAERLGIIDQTECYTLVSNDSLLETLLAAYDAGADAEKAEAKGAEK